MSAQILDPSIFAARINLWVEDEVTRVTLAEYWQDIDIRVSSAAGSTGVKHLTAASQLPAGGANIVVGVIDRDFGTDNQAKGSDTEKILGPHSLGVGVHTGCASVARTRSSQRPALSCARRWRTASACSSSQ